MKHFILLLLTLLIPLNPAFAKVIATVSQNPAYAERAFTLEVTTDRSVSTDAFDTTPLLRQGFVVGNTSVSTSHNFFNGRSEQSTSWQTTIMMREPGEYTIPALTVGGEQSKPIELKVLAEPTLSADEQQEVKLEVSLDKASAYVGESVIYTNKLLYTSALQQRSSLNAPDIPNVQIYQLGEANRGMEVLNGKRYQTYTRRWLITPSQPGPIEIAGPTIQGRVAVAPGYRRSQLKGVTLTGDAKVLEVNPIPDNFPGRWLPSQAVVLDERLEPEQTSYTRGEAFTRTITLTIAGVTEDQLPELSIDYGPAFRVYPDEVQDRTIVQDGQVFAQRTMSLALIPVETGNLELPGIRLPWWNLSQDKLDWSLIEPRQIEVLPDPGANQLPQLPLEATQPQGVTSQWSHWSTLFASLWLLTLIGWGLTFRKLKQPVAAPLEASPQPEVPNAWADFEQAAKQSDAKRADSALTLWRQQNRQTSNEIVDALATELSQIAWGESAESWSGVEFLSRVKAARKGADKTKKGSELAALNP